MANIINRYESVEAYASSLSEHEPYDEWKEYGLASEGTRRGWYGCSMDEAVKLLSKGWATGAKAIKTNVDIICKGGKRVPRLYNSVVGCVPNVPNYLMGLPKQMMQVRTEHRHKPVIDVYVGTDIYDGIDTDEVSMAAAKIANVVTSIEKSGVRINLYTVSAIDGQDGNNYLQITKIKDSRAPLNLLNIAFPLTHRAYCRRINLRWMETHIDHRLSGYGRPLGESEITDILNNKGVFFNIIDIVGRRTSIEEMTSKVNEYLKQY